MASASDPEFWLDEHGDALYAYAMLRVHNSATAEDLVQDTLIAGIDALATFKQGSSVRTWLTAILKNKIIDLIRKSSRETQLDGSYEDNQFDAQFLSDGHWASRPSDWGDPARIMQNEELGNDLMDCISRLPEKLRTLIVLREIDGFETEQLVTMLNISSANNLWVMLSRARDRVRSCLDKRLAGQAR